MSNQRLVIVGGTNGLGQAIGRQALAQGAEVTVVGRTFRDRPTPGLRFVAADLSSMREAARVADELPVEPADILLFTNGIFASRDGREQTPEGIERDLAVSYLSRLAVVQRVHARLGVARPAGAPRARVFVMGAPGTGQLGEPGDLNSERDYSAMRAHSNTIAGNEALVVGAAERFPGPAFFGLSPGVVKTGIRSNMFSGGAGYRAMEGLIGLLFPSPEGYARRILPVITGPELEGRGGTIFDRKGRPKAASKGFDAAYAARVLDASDELLTRALAKGSSRPEVS
ncbi:hypothetical protein [Actinoplanes sp. NPDC049265]|uniref:hypothetical protein n=1 Tax=Actinoplanes sp. NPDC049265 TaxID=3363902 RepID=UPI00371114ED